MMPVLADQNTLRFTCIISGAISLGAYEAGVLSQFIYALDHWNAENGSDKPPLAIVDVVSGASAGAMTGGMLFEHVARGGDPAQFVKDNFNTWCGKTLTFQNLLTDRVDSTSILSTPLIDDIGKEFIPDQQKTAVNQDRIRQSECIFTCTLTAIDAIPLKIEAQAFPAANTPNKPVLGTTYHDWISFRSGKDNPDIIEELPDNCQAGQGRPANWKRVRTCAVASGMITAVWEPTKITRYRADYRLPIDEAQLTVDTPAIHYVDGGILDNMPLDRASEILTSLKEPGDEKSRVHLLVLPGLPPRNTDFKQGNAATDGRDGAITPWAACTQTIAAAHEQTFYLDLWKSQRVNERLATRDQFVAPTLRKAADSIPDDGLPAEISRVENLLAPLIKRYGFTTPDAIIRAYEETDPSASAATAARPQPGSAYRVHAQNSQPALRDRLYYLYLALSDQVSDLYDRSLIRVGVITPGPNVDLAGRQLGDFGAFISQDLMIHDFAQGVQDACDWCTSFAAASNWNVKTRSVMDDNIIEAVSKANLEDSPWAKVDGKQRKSFMFSAIKRLTFFTTSQFGCLGLFAWLVWFVVWAVITVKKVTFTPKAVD